MQLGKYRHFRGREYEVIGLAHDSETLDEIVVYRALYNSPEFGDQALWVRPRADFEALVDQDGQQVPRFQFIH
jgi:hypothetical protein